MIPNAKKNLHECEHHLHNMIQPENPEKFEINFSAFVNSARNVTFILQKQFTHNNIFQDWYGEKQEEMRNDELCRYFHTLRNEIIKEGKLGLKYVTEINALDMKKDFLNRPPNSKVTISKGINYLLNEGTGREDIIPAKTTATFHTLVAINNKPTKHLGKDINNKNIIEISRLYYLYLKNMVEERTAIINKYQ